MSATVIVGLVIIGAIGLAYFKQSVEIDTESRIESYELWKSTGLISQGIVKHYPTMQRDLTRDESVQSKYREHVEASEHPLRYYDWLRREGYED